MKYLKDVRVQLAIGAIFFFIALIDSFLVEAERLSDLSVIGKVSTAIVCLVLAWSVVRYIIVGLIFRRK